MPATLSPPCLALNMSVYDEVPLVDAIARAFELGYTAVELVADVPQLFPPSTPMRHVHELAAQVRAMGVRIVNMNAETGRGFFSPIPSGAVYEPSMITPREGMRRLRQQSLARTLDFALALECPCVTVASGAVQPGLSPAMAWELLLDNMADLLGQAEQVGVLVAIAPRPGQLIARLEDCLALMEDMPHPLLGVCLDLAQLAGGREPVPAAALALAGRIWVVQATDAKLPSGYRVAPGQGDLDLAWMIEALLRTGYVGPWTLQLENYVNQPDQAAIGAFAAMERLFAACPTTPRN